MKVHKLIKSKIKRDYFFITGKVSIDINYFIKEIEKGIKRKDNENYKTNLIAEMTEYRYFVQDQNFYKMISPFLDFIDEENLSNHKRYSLVDAWGFKQQFSHYTKPHDHLPAVISGAVMLSEHTQHLHFPQINQTLKCEPGNFALFSSFLLHKNKRNIITKPRYGLSFNWNIVNTVS